MKMCEWCGLELDNVNTYEVLGTKYTICDKCVQASDNDVCITCGEPLYGQMAIKGECCGCQQIRAAKAEKKRSEIMNGLDIDALSELTSSVTFTEEDYDKWVTFGQGNFTPELRRKHRKDWIKNKLMTESNWSEELFNNNEEDLDFLIDNYSNKMFNKSYSFAIKGTKIARTGINIIAQKGNVMIIEN